MVALRECTFKETYLGVSLVLYVSMVRLMKNAFLTIYTIGKYYNESLNIINIS